MTKKAFTLAAVVFGVASASGCSPLCFVPCVVCGELSAPQLAMQALEAEPLPELGPALAPDVAPVGAAAPGR